MKTTFAGMLICAVTWCLTGCGGGLPDPESIDSHEEGAEAVLQAMEHLAEVLEGVQTVEDAESAAIEIEELTATLKAVAAKLKELPPPTDAEMKAISTDLGPRGEAIRERIKATSERIKQSPEVSAVLQEAVWDLRFSSFDFDIETQQDIARREAREAEHEQRLQEADARRAAARDPRNLAPPTPPGGGTGSFEPTPGAHPALAILQRQFGVHRVVDVHVTQIPATIQRGEVLRALRQIAEERRIIPVRQAGSSEAHFYMAPVDDPRAFANKITFGTVEPIDETGRVITVRYQP